MSKDIPISLQASENVRNSKSLRDCFKKYAIPKDRQEKILKTLARGIDWIDMHELYFLNAKDSVKKTCAINLISYGAFCCCMVCVFWCEFVAIYSLWSLFGHHPQGYQA